MGTGIDTFTIVADDVDTQLPVTGLQPFTFYTIQLVAINEVRLESQPAEVNVTTVSLRKDILLCERESGMWKEIEG